MKVNISKAENGYIVEGWDESDTWNKSSIKIFPFSEKQDMLLFVGELIDIDAPNTGANPELPDMEKDG